LEIDEYNFAKVPAGRITATAIVPYLFVAVVFSSSIVPYLQWDRSAYLFRTFHQERTDLSTAEVLQVQPYSVEQLQKNN